MQKLHFARQSILLPLAAMFTTVGLFAGQANAGLIFTIDTFTSDNLTIKLADTPINELGGSASSKDLFFFATDESQKDDWILQSTQPTTSGSGSLGGIAVQVSSFDLFDNNAAGGDIARATFDSNLNTGDVVTDALTFTWSGTNLFNPDAVDSLSLTWGTSGIGTVHPWGQFQSSTSVSSPAAVPEPTSFACLGLGALVLAGVSARRRRK